jgi:nucleoside-diphosphate-sugar epimerase
LSLETASVPSLTSLLTSERPDAVVWSAGAGGKGDKSRTRTVDFEAAVKVFDALEAANVKRLLYVGAIDVRDKTQPPPKYYTPESGESTESGSQSRKRAPWPGGRAAPGQEGGLEADYHSGTE